MPQETASYFAPENSRDAIPETDPASSPCNCEECARSAFVGADEERILELRRKSVVPDVDTGVGSDGLEDQSVHNETRRIYLQNLERVRNLAMDAIENSSQQYYATMREILDKDRKDVGQDQRFQHFLLAVQRVHERAAVCIQEIEEMFNRYSSL